MWLLFSLHLITSLTRTKDRLTLGLHNAAANDLQLLVPKLKMKSRRSLIPKEFLLVSVYVKENSSTMLPVPDFNAYVVQTYNKQAKHVIMPIIHSYDLF